LKFLEVYRAFQEDLVVGSYPGSRRTEKSRVKPPVVGAVLKIR
jgi:hypothetical protein